MLYILPVIILMLVPCPVQAEYFVWQKNGQQITIEFPDDWALGHNQAQGDILTVVAPVTQGQNDFAQCTLSRYADGRFGVYVRPDADSLQAVYFSHDYWPAYVGRYEGAVLHRLLDDAGLGDVFTSRADMSFITPGSPKMLKRAFAFAGYMDGYVYSFSCEAEFEAFADWYGDFGNILSSVKVKTRAGQSLTGLYRPFDDDLMLIIRE